MVLTSTHNYTPIVYPYSNYFKLTFGSFQEKTVISCKSSGPSLPCSFILGPPIRHAESFMCVTEACTPRPAPMELIMTD